MISSSTAIAIVGSILTIFSVGIAFLTFWINRKKDSSSDGEWRGELKSDIRHIRDGIDDLKADTKNIKDDVNELRERVSQVETSAEAAHKRIDDMIKG